MTVQPVRHRAPRPRTQPRDRRPVASAHQWLVFEIWLKISAHVVLSIVALGAIVKLLPYQQLQQAKLEEVHLAALEKEERVNELREEFTRNFDPNQAKQVMREQSPRRDPNQRRIFWTR